MRHYKFILIILIIFVSACDYEIENITITQTITDNKNTFFVMNVSQTVNTNKISSLKKLITYKKTYENCAGFNLMEPTTATRPGAKLVAVFKGYSDDAGSITADKFISSNYEIVNKQLHKYTASFSITKELFIKADIDDTSPPQSISFSYTLNIPGKIIKTNGKKIDKDSVRFADNISADSYGEKIECFVEFIPGAAVSKSLRDYKTYSRKSDYIQLIGAELPENSKESPAEKSSAETDIPMIPDNESQLLLKPPAITAETFRDLLFQMNDSNYKAYYGISYIRNYSKSGFNYILIYLNKDWCSNDDMQRRIWYNQLKEVIKNIKPNPIMYLVKSNNKHLLVK